LGGFLFFGGVGGVPLLAVTMSPPGPFPCKTLHPLPLWHRFSPVLVPVKAILPFHLSLSPPFFTSNSGTHEQSACPPNLSGHTFFPPLPSTPIHKLILVLAPSLFTKIRFSPSSLHTHLRLSISHPNTSTPSFPPKGVFTMSMTCFFFLFSNQL